MVQWGRWWFGPNLCGGNDCQIRYQYWMHCDSLRNIVHIVTHWRGIVGNPGITLRYIKCRVDCTSDKFTGRKLHQQYKFSQCCFPCGEEKTKVTNDKGEDDGIERTHDDYNDHWMMDNGHIVTQGKIHGHSPSQSHITRKASNKKYSDDLRVMILKWLPIQMFMVQVMVLIGLTIITMVGTLWLNGQSDCHNPYMDTLLLQVTLH